MAAIPPDETRLAAAHDAAFHSLLAFLARLPAIAVNETESGGLGSGTFKDGNWWVKFSLDIAHPLAWSVVQELGHVFNLVSATERLPTIFKPVSPAPGLNGGPAEFLSWVVESTDPTFTPDLAQQWLLSRLPDPIDDPVQWAHDP